MACTARACSARVSHSGERPDRRQRLPCLVGVGGGIGVLDVPLDERRDGERGRFFVRTST